MSIIKQYQQQIFDIQEKIKEVQDACSHPPTAVTKINKGSTGNPFVFDEYWRECHCGLCEKRWSEDQ